MPGPAAIHYATGTAPTLTGWGGNGLMAVNAFASRVHADRCLALRTAGTELLEYALVVHDYPGSHVGVPEWASFYNGSAGTSYGRAAIPPEWFWDPSNPGRVVVGAYAGQVLDMRVGSAWVEHLLAWFAARLASASWKLDGWFLDVLGDDYLGAISGLTSGEQADYRAGVRDFAARLRAVVGDECLLVANNTWQTAAPLNGICVENHTGSNIGNPYWLAQLSRHDAPLGRVRNMSLNGNLSDVQAWGAVAGITHAALHSNDGYQIAPTPPFGTVATGAWPPELGHIHLWDSTGGSGGEDPGPDPDPDPEPPPSLRVPRPRTVDPQRRRVT